MVKRFSFALICCAATTWSSYSAANCGQAVCAVNTDWEAQGVRVDKGTRLDLRFEYVDQDQPRAGSRKVAVGEIPKDHDEVRTINRNWIATLDHSFDNQWGLSVSLPYLSRHHEHIHNDPGGPEPESWVYDKIGDARIVGRYQGALPEQARYAWGLTAGVKLPTGKHDVANESGEVAERTLQPGTGTTDLILGGFYHQSMEVTDAFAQIQLQHALDKKDEFEPGMRVAVDLGLRYPFSEHLALLGQINLLYRGRDSGNQAEPDDSGGRFVFFSPGISVELTRSLRAYSFLQLPLYQHVNGVQLTADWALSVGVSARF